MSAKKSWDIRPNTNRVLRIPADPVIPRRPLAGAPPRERLKSRRRRARKRVLVLLAVLFLVLLGASVYALWRPELRIRDVSIQAADAASLDPLVKGAVAGNYFGILPRDSFFFFPKEAIRQAILNAYPDISAVSISRTSLTSIEVSTIERVSAFNWCGAAPDDSAPCYQTDAEGFIFASSAADIPEDGATSTPSKTLRIYAPLTESAAGGDTPVRSHVENAAAIPAALRFERAVLSLGADVASLDLRGDEADLFTRAGTRITYVLGHEAAAAQLAATAFPQLNLNDGSVLYVDLRFDGKVYFKKKGEE